MAGSLAWPDLAVLVDAVKCVAASSAAAACTPSGLRSPSASFAFGSPATDPYLLARGLSEPSCDVGFASPIASRASRSNSFRGTEALSAWLKDELASSCDAAGAAPKDGGAEASLDSLPSAAVVPLARGRSEEALSEPRRVLVFDDGEEGQPSAPGSGRWDARIRVDTGASSCGGLAFDSAESCAGSRVAINEGAVASELRARHASCWSSGSGSSSEAASCAAHDSKVASDACSAPRDWSLGQCPPRAASVQEALSLVRLLCAAPVALAALRQPGGAARLLSPRNPRLLLSPGARPRRAASDEGGSADDEDDAAGRGAEGRPVISENDPIACIRYACVALEALWPLPIVALSHTLLRALRFVPAVRVELPAFCDRVEAALAGGTTAALDAGGPSASPQSPLPLPRASPLPEGGAARTGEPSPASPRYWPASPPASARKEPQQPAADWAALLRASRDADAAEAADVRTIMNQQVNYQAVPGVQAPAAAASASRGPLDLSLPFSHDAESRHNLKSRAEVDGYQAREKLRDAFLTLLREYRDAGCSFNGPASPAEVLASLPTRVPAQLKPLLVAHPKNATWFARLFLHELVLFSVHEAVIGGFMPGGLQLGPSSGAATGAAGSKGGSAGAGSRAVTTTGAAGSAPIGRTVSPSPTAAGGRTGSVGPRDGGEGKAARAAQKAAGERVATTLVADAGVDPSKLEKLSARLAPAAASGGGRQGGFGRGADGPLGNAASLLDAAPVGNLVEREDVPSAVGGGDQGVDDEGSPVDALAARMGTPAAGGGTAGKAAPKAPPASVTREAALIMRLQVPEGSKPVPAAGTSASAAAPGAAKVWGGGGKSLARLGLASVPAAVPDSGPVLSRPAEPKPTGAAAVAAPAAPPVKRRAVLQQVQEDVKPQGTWAKLVGGGASSQPVEAPAGAGAAAAASHGPLPSAASLSDLPAPAAAGAAAKKRVKLQAMAQPGATPAASSSNHVFEFSSAASVSAASAGGGSGAVARRPMAGSGPRSGAGISSFAAAAAPIPLAALLPESLVARTLVGSEALFWQLLVHFDCSGLWAAVRGLACAELGNACHAATVAAHMHKHGHKTVFLYTMRLRCLARTLVLSSLAELLPGLSSSFPAEVVAVRDAIKRSPPPIDFFATLATAEEEGTLPVMVPVLADLLRTVDACIPAGVPLPTWVPTATGLLLRVAERTQAAATQPTQALLLALCLLELHGSSPRLVEEAARVRHLPLWAECAPPPAPATGEAASGAPQPQQLVVGHRLLLSVSHLYRATVSEVGSATTTLARAVAVAVRAGGGRRPGATAPAADGALSPTLHIIPRTRGASGGEVEDDAVPASLPGGAVVGALGASDSGPAAPATPSRSARARSSADAFALSSDGHDGASLVDTSLVSATAASFTMGSPSAVQPRKIVPTLIRLPGAASAASGSGGGPASRATVAVRAWGRDDRLAGEGGGPPPLEQRAVAALPREAAQLSSAGPLLQGLQASLESAFARSNPVRHRLLEALAEATAHDLAAGAAAANGSTAAALRVPPELLRAQVEATVVAVLKLSSCSGASPAPAAPGEVLACTGLAHRMLLGELARLGVSLAEA